MSNAEKKESSWLATLAMMVALGFIIGFVMQMGQRAAEWLVKAPPTTVMFCTVDGFAQSAECEMASDLIRQYREVNRAAQ